MVILAALGAIGLASLMGIALGRASARSDEQEDRLIAKRKQLQARAAKKERHVGATNEPQARAAQEKQAPVAGALLEAREHEPSR